MTVRSALARINEILDEVLNEQESAFDDPTRFAIAWYRQHGYSTGEFGVADGLARARNSSVDAMEREGISQAVPTRSRFSRPRSCRRATTFWRTTGSARGRCCTT